MTRPSSRDHLLVDRELRALCGRAVRPASGSPPLDLHPTQGQVQSASLDLRLGATAYRIRAGFLPGRVPIRERLAELETGRLDLGGRGAVLERGLVYLVLLDEELELPRDVAARFNPRSSCGRCDLFTRVLVPGHPRFNETPPGYRGPIWLEVASLSFPVRLTHGDRLCQMRLQRGKPALSESELRAEYRAQPLLFRGREPVPEEDLRFHPDGGVELHLGLEGRDPAGWRARSDTGVLEFGRERAHAARDFFEPLAAPGGHCLLTPGGFHLFASRERVCIPPHLAAEMVPVDVEIGELRNNYAGFFDNGFGWAESHAAGGSDRRPGTPAVLEVRAHDVPFLAEDGQVFFRLRFFATLERPAKLYGEGRATDSYRDQDLTLARTFR